MSDLYFPGLDTAPSRLHPYFGGSVGMASPSSALNRTSHPLPSGEKAEELYLQAVRRETKQLSSLLLCSSVLPCVAGRVYRCLEPPSPVPLLLGQPLSIPSCSEPPMLSTSAGSHQCSQPLPGRKSCATNHKSKGKIWKGQF